MQIYFSDYNRSSNRKFINITIFLIRHTKSGNQEMVVDGKPTIWISNGEDMAPWIIIDLEKEVTIWKVVITVGPVGRAFRGFAGIKVKCRNM